MKPDRHPLLHARSLLTIIFPLLASLASSAVADDGLGRLFFTPERRQHLDRQRQLNIQQDQDIPDDPTLTINGIVTRSSGKSTTWINSVPQHENEMAGGIAVTTSRRTPGDIVVQTPESNSAKAKVGDTINRNTGDSTDLLIGGSISVKRLRTANGK